MRDRRHLSSKNVVSKHEDSRAVADEVRDRLHNVPWILPPGESGQQAELQSHEAEADPRQTIGSLLGLHCDLSLQLHRHTNEQLHTSTVKLTRRGINATTNFNTSSPTQMATHRYSRAFCFSTHLTLSLNPENPMLYNASQSAIQPQKCPFAWGHLQSTSPCIACSPDPPDSEFQIASRPV